MPKIEESKEVDNSGVLINPDESQTKLKLQQMISVSDHETLKRILELAEGIKASKSN